MTGVEERRTHPDSPGHTRPRDEATEYIEYYILEKNLPPHAKLPSERDMCSMWGFNRTTLRSGIKRLIVEGKLYNRKGSGTFVAPPKLERDLQDAMSVSEAVYMAGRTLETKVLEVRVLMADHHMAQKLQVEQGTPVFYLHRDRDDRAVDVRGLVLWAVGFAAYRGLMMVDLPLGSTIPDIALTVVLCVVVDKLTAKTKA